MAEICTQDISQPVAIVVVPITYLFGIRIDPLLIVIAVVAPAAERDEAIVVEVSRHTRAGTQGAGVLHGARVAVVAGRGVEREHAARARVAAVVGAGIQVLAGQVVGGDHAAERRIAPLRGAGEPVVAAAPPAHRAHPPAAHVLAGAQVAVLAGGGVRGVGAAGDRVATIVRARVAVLRTRNANTGISDAGVILATLWTDRFNFTILTCAFNTHAWNGEVGHSITIIAESMRRRIAFLSSASGITSLIRGSIAVVVEYVVTQIYS
ncbi:MAG TPA: hypothetical protein PK668_13160 [Myxococcota bacterium]|nr:hypothetical protein [Myxococcota bacterium]HRY93582.1 hypothetical protein [Myxococcota bacterium]